MTDLRQAAQQALEALENVESAMYVTSEGEAVAFDKASEAITALREALAQPKQEPWRESASDYERGVIDGRQMQAQSSVDKAVNAMTQRPWIGLTDDDRFEIAAEQHGWEDLLIAAEARLKEKNNG